MKRFDDKQTWMMKKASSDKWKLIDRRREGEGSKGE